MIKNEKTVKFISTNVDLNIVHPKPSSKFIPEWFRKLPGVVTGTETIKKCMPFLDSMTAGYTIVLAADLKFDGDDFENISKLDLVAKHLSEQLGDLDLPLEFNKTPFKWINYFVLKTPKGHSTLFTHPLNRIDLPFYSLSGIVDTDTFPAPVNFPFFIKKGFRGVIPAGTPIIQAIPFKRSSWKMTVDDESRYELPHKFYAHANPPFNFYKKHYWNKKTYN